MRYLIAGVIIFCIGDSYTQGVGVSADNAYPFQLYQLLNANKNTKNRIGVVNLGVIGYGTLMSIERLKEFKNKISTPSAILFLGVENDYADDQAFQKGLKHRHLVQNSKYHKWRLPFYRFLTHHFQIGMRIKFACSSFKEQTLKKENSNVYNLATIAELEFPNIIKMKNIAEKWNADLIVSWDDTPSSYRWLKNKCKSTNIKFADWITEAKIISKDLPAIKFENSHSGGHYRAWVYQCIATAFARELDGNTTNHLPQPAHLHSTD